MDLSHLVAMLPKPSVPNGPMVLRLSTVIRWSREESTVTFTAKVY